MISQTKSMKILIEIQLSNLTIIFQIIKLKIKCLLIQEDSKIQKINLKITKLLIRF